MRLKGCAAVLTVMAVEVAGCTSPSTATSAAAACVSAYTAGAEYTAGERSLDSTMSVLGKAEGDERQAAGQDTKYQTVVDDIVGLEADLTGTGSGGHLQFLSEDCGPDHG